jgi:two-component SAPR family response regulator
MFIWNCPEKESAAMIKIVLVDDEKPSLDILKYMLGRYDKVEVTGMFQDAVEALGKISEMRPDAVFIDIDMPGMNGLELALKIQEFHAGIIIVFVTAYSEYALSAFRAYPLDYLVKPMDDKRLGLTMEHLIEQYEYHRQLLHYTAKTSIRCFGNFEIFSENGEKRYIKFATRQVKELFAYLIHRFERPVTRTELIEYVFGGIEDSKTINLLHVTAYKLRNALEDIGASRSSITIRGNYILETAEGVCDFVDFMKFTEKNMLIDDDNIKEAEYIAGLYVGSYLEHEDYEWAQETRAEIELRHEKLLLNMAHYFSDTHKLQKSEKTLLTLLSSNPLSDEGNNTLLDLYISSKNCTKFKTFYEEYAARLEEELGAEPETRYTDFYYANFNG